MHCNASEEHEGRFWDEDILLKENHKAQGDHDQMCVWLDQWCSFRQN